MHSKNHEDHPLRRLIIPAVAMVVLLLPMLYVDIVRQHAAGHILPRVLLALHRGLGIAVWLSGAWLASRALDVLFWEAIVARRMKAPVPRLLKDVVAFLVYTFAVFGIFGSVFGLPLNGVLATSGAIGVVIGLALRNIIADVFSGIAINVEQSFKIGDWIALDSGETGEVLEVNWRTTTIRSIADIVTVVPNSRISSAEFKNYSRPRDHFRWSLEFHLDYDVPTERALRVLNAAARGVETSNPDLKADALIADIDSLGVKYWVRFWVPRYPELGPLRSRVIASVMRNLYQAGLSPVHSKHDVYTAPMPSRQLDEHADMETLLGRIDLFDPLTPEEMRSLAGSVHRREIDPGETVVAEGEAGDSLFVLVEGLLAVTKNKDGGGGDIHVGRIRAGDFFGEVSLLTGEPRSATIITVTESVIYEIGKEDFEPLLKNRPDLCVSLSDKLAERQMRAGRAFEHHDRAREAEEKKDLAKQFFQKMTGFFTFLKGSVTYK